MEWAQRRGNDDTLVIVTPDHETSGLAIAGFWDGSKIVYTVFPEYSDADKDGFPDTLRIDRPLDIWRQAIKRFLKPSQIVSKIVTIQPDACAFTFGED